MRWSCHEDRRKFGDSSHGGNACFRSEDPRGFILRSAVPTRHALRMQGKVQTNKLIEFKLTDMQILFATLRDGGMAYG